MKSTHAMELAAAASFILCLSSRQLVAEPSRTVQRLMETPVSLFSFGIYLLDKDLQTLLSAGEGLSLQPPLSVHEKYFQEVNYDWVKNQLILTAKAIRGSAVPRPERDQECKQVINAIRHYFGVSSDTGKPYFGKFSTLQYYFSPSGYALQWFNEDSFNELDQNTTVAFTDTEFGDDHKIFKCDAALMGTGYSVAKQ